MQVYLVKSVNIEFILEFNTVVYYICLVNVVYELEFLPSVWPMMIHLPQYFSVQNLVHDWKIQTSVQAGNII